MNTEDQDLLHFAGTDQSMQWQLPVLPWYSEIISYRIIHKMLVMKFITEKSVSIYGTEVLADVTNCNI
jgi:hypothetical protein